MSDLEEEFVIVQPVWVVALTSRPHVRAIDSIEHIVKFTAARDDIAGRFIAVLTDRDQAERMIDDLIAKGEASPGDLESLEFPKQSDFVAFLAKLMELGHERIALDPGKRNVRTPPIRRFFEWFREHP